MQRAILLSLVVVGVLYLPVHRGLAKEIPAPCGEATPCDDAPLATSAADVSIATLTYEELKSLLESTADFVLLDTRTVEAYKFGHIPKAESFPLMEINPESVKKLSKDKLIVVYCQAATCRMSHDAAVKLKSFGFDVKDYHGGVQEWLEKGHKLEVGTTVTLPATP